MKKMKILAVLISSCLLLSINTLSVYAGPITKQRYLDMEGMLDVALPGLGKIGLFSDSEQILEAEAEGIEVIQGSPQYYTVSDGGYQATLPKEMQDWIYQMCVEYGIAGYEKTILAKLYVESSYNPDTVYANTNGTKDYGMAQINSSNHHRLRSTLGVTDFLDPYQSIQCGIYMLSECLHANGFDEEMALAAYNTGKNGISTTSYSRKVLRIKEALTLHEFE